MKSNTIHCKYTLKIYINAMKKKRNLNFPTLRLRVSYVLNCTENNVKFLLLIYTLFSYEIKNIHFFFKQTH